MSVGASFFVSYAKPDEAASFIEGVLRKLAGLPEGAPMPDDIKGATRTGLAIRLAGFPLFCSPRKGAPLE